MPTKNIHIVVGARPNYMKAAPLYDELKAYSQFDVFIIHTGQHYDEEMNKVFFDDLGLPKPSIYLGVGSGTHAYQTGTIMQEYEKILLSQRPDLIMVVGDVNSTIACALDAAKLHIPVAHIEAGLRSFDRTMPEEINRLLTDQISDFLFTTCDDADKNLKNEGIPESKIFLVGNVMIDSLLKFIERARRSDGLSRLGLKKPDGSVQAYALLTLHRPSNVDDPQILKNILDALNTVARRIPLIFPIHPRTLKQIKSFALEDMIRHIDQPESIPLDLSTNKVVTIPPLGYLDFLSLMAHASFVLTDSGGIQEETTILGIPCLTLRSNTERPITISEGTNYLVGNDFEKIVSQSLNIFETGGKKGRLPKLWDGRAASRIVRILSEAL
jgi:UDP-N-acetylglucosamine 2-epimerase (non-hydrolysing)